MTGFRSRLRACSSAWLVIQFVALMTGLPLRGDAASALVECEAAATGDICPMRDADGVPCPMHQAGAEHSDEARADCRMGATGTASTAGLAPLFSIPGVLPRPAEFGLTPRSSAVPPVFFVLVDSPLAHDSPPPRA